MTEEARKTTEDMLQSAEVGDRPMVRSGFDDHLNGKLRPGYTKPSLAIDDVRHSWIFNCRQQVCFRELGANENYKHTTSFLFAFLIRHAQTSCFHRNQFYFYETEYGSTALQL